MQTRLSTSRMATLTAEQAAEMMTRVVGETLTRMEQAGRLPGQQSWGGTAGDSDEFKNFLKEMVNQIKKPNGGGVGTKTLLDERNFRRLEKFSNKEVDWEAWQANVEVAIAAVHQTTARMMEVVAKVETLDMQKLKDLIEVEAFERELNQEEIEKADGELFQHLCLWTVGEANTIVRGVREKCGLIAWRRLLTRFAPRTAARRLQAMMNIMRPQKAKDVRSFGKTLESWELQLQAFTTNFSETVSMGMQVAIVIGMAPAEIQDIIFQNWKGEGGEEAMQKEWKMVRDRVMALVANRISMSTPTPMDIGEVQDEWWQEDVGGAHPHCHYSAEDEEEADIGAIGKGDGACRRCGGKGHFARECSTPFGKGIEKAKGGGKAGSKGGGKSGGTFAGYGKGSGDWQGKYGGKPHPGAHQSHGDGKGKGYQGACFKCGKVGHKAFECRSIQMVEGDGDEKIIDGVWMVGQVGVESTMDEEVGWSVMAKKKKKKPKTEVMKKVDGEDVMISVVERDGWIRAGEAAEITIDSAADESVCPQQWGDMFKLKEVQNGKEIKLRSANGGKIMRYGRRNVTFEVEGDSSVKLMGLGFEASDVRKPLAAVHRIVEKGNKVQFGPNPEDNFIQNIATNEKVHMRKKGRSYVLGVELVKPIVETSPTFRRQP